MLSLDSPVAVNGHSARQAPSMSPALSAATSTTFVKHQTSSQMASSAAAPAPAGSSKHHHIWLVTGPAGCGKTTVAEYIAGELDLPYLEGDSVSRKASNRLQTSHILFLPANTYST